MRRKEREATGLFRVEGLAQVGAALESESPVEFLVTAPGQLRGDYAQSLLDTATRRQIQVYKISPDLFASIAEKDNPQGILAVVRWRWTTLQNFTPQSHPWLVAAVAPQDPGNVGTILRTLDAAGANGLVLLDDAVDPTHPTAVRASLGSLFQVPIAKNTFELFARWARESGYAIVGSSTHAANDYRSMAWRKPAILLLGSERTGLTTEQVATCHTVVRLPMKGKATSLNLAVAAGILLYEMAARFEEQ